MMLPVWCCCAAVFNKYRRPFQRLGLTRCRTCSKGTKRCWRRERRCGWMDAARARSVLILGFVLCLPSAACVAVAHRHPVTAAAWMISVGPARKSNNTVVLHANYERTSGKEETSCSVNSRGDPSALHISDGSRSCQIAPVGKKKSMHLFDR